MLPFTGAPMSTPQKALLVFMLCTFQVFAASFYVSGTGSCQGNVALETIQEAIDAANDGDSIVVCADSSYVENVIVNKSVNIHGPSATNQALIIAEAPSNPVFTIVSDRVNISNFILRDATGSYGLYSTASYGKIQDVSSTNNDIGFYLYSGSHNTLISNTAHDNFDEGFRLAYSDYNTLENNLAYNQLYYGFYLVESSNNEILSNTAHDSYLWYGVFLYTGATENHLFNNTAYGNAHHGFHVYLNSDNNFTSNTAFNNADEGFRFSSTSGNYISENEAYGNLLNGFLISSSSGNELISNNAHDNSQYGFYLHQSTDNLMFSNEAHDQEDGFMMFGSSDNTLDSNTAYQNENGFYLDISSGNTLDSNTAHDNNEHGFLLSSSSENNLSDNLVYGNGLYGIYAYLSSTNTILRNDVNMNSDGIRISASSQNLLEENSVHDNQGDGINLYSSGHNKLFGNNATANGRYGIYLYESPDNELNLNNAWENDRGFNIYLSPKNELTGNNAYQNEYGILVSSSSNNKLNDNLAWNNSLHGIQILNSQNNRLSGNTANDNGGFGSYIHSSTNSVIENEHYFGNSDDFCANASSALKLTASNIIFDNPSGNYQHYANISISDKLSPNSSYVITWTTQPDALPYPQMSFGGKYLDISATPGLSIDSFSWHWLDSEAGSGYEESKFRLWQHDELGWVLLEAQTDKKSNKIKRKDLVPKSVYAILQNQTPPSFELHSPISNESLNTTGLQLSWSVFSSNPSLFCDLMLDGQTANGNPLNITSGTPAHYSTTLQEGAHSWSVTCTDSVGTNSSQTMDFFVDLPPEVSLESSDDVLSNSTDYGLVFSVSDNLSDSVNCSLLLDGSVHLVQEASADSGSETFTIHEPDEGQHSLQVLCEDDAGNTGASEIVQATFDRTAPELSLISPEDGYLGSDNSMAFVFLSSDESDVTSSLYIDGVLEGTTSSNQLNAWPSEGVHQWYIISTDLAGNSVKSETRQFTLDHTPPTITVYSPQHPKKITSSAPQNVDFDFTATDDYADSIECTFTLDQDDTQHSIEGTEHITFTRNLALGTHQYWVICTDEVSNSRTTPIRTIWIGTASDDDDDDPEPLISLTSQSNCLNNTATIRASSGSGTFIRLIDPDGILLGSGTTDPNNVVVFTINNSGLYQVRATKSNYRSAVLEFYYTACQDSDDEDDNHNEDDDAGTEDLPGQNETGAQGGGSGPEENSSDGNQEEPPESPPEHEVDIFVDDVAYKGENVEVEVYVDGEPAGIRLRVTSPGGSRAYFLTDASGITSFHAKEAGNYSILVVEDGLPQEVAYVEVLEEMAFSSAASREDFSLILCIPCLLPLILALIIAYLATEEDKQKKRYSGYGKKENGIKSRLKQLLKRKRSFGK